MLILCVFTCSATNISLQDINIAWSYYEPVGSMYAVAYGYNPEGKGMFVVTNNNGYVQYSYNGINWLSSDLSFSSGNYMIVYGMSNYTSDHYGSVRDQLENGGVGIWIVHSFSSRNIYYSYDSITWQTAYDALPYVNYMQEAYGLVWNNDVQQYRGMFVMKREMIGIIYSYDGINWFETSYTDGHHNMVYADVSYELDECIRYGMFITNMYYSIVCYSYDGLTWKTHEALSNSYTYMYNGYGYITDDITGDVTKVFAYMPYSTGYDYAPAYSYNGLDWYVSNDSPQPFQTSPKQLIYFNDGICTPMLVSSYGSNWIYTVNGSHWITSSSTASYTITDFASGLVEDGDEEYYVNIMVASGIYYSRALYHNECDYFLEQEYDDKGSTTETDIITIDDAYNNITSEVSTTSSLSVGAIIGIIIACVVVLICIIVGIVVGVKNKKHKRVRVRMYIY